MEALTEILRLATAAIAPEYFLLPIDGAPGVYRERVYCDELYHQMRRLWPEGSPWFLNGEVDKGAHPYFMGEQKPKPDFLVHIPGHENNHAALEVKSARASAHGLRKDLRTLVRFMDRDYGRGILIIYGVTPNEALLRIQHCGAEPQQIAAIELWVHRAVHEPAERVALPDLQSG